MPAALRLSEEQLQEILDRRKREGGVRVHKISDESPTPDPTDDLKQAAKIAQSIPMLPRTPRKPLSQVLDELPGVAYPKRPRQRVQKPVVAERDILKGCLQLLELHPKVGFSWRQNTGMAMNAQGKRIFFSTKGCADILGALVDGRFLAVECKATGKKANPDQQAFLDAVNRAGGLGICVDDVDKLRAALEAAA